MPSATRYTRLQFAVAFVPELVRFLVAELRAGHTGTFGLHGYQFFANELLAGRYKGAKQQMVAEFVFHAASERSDQEALAIAIRYLGGRA